jgi:aminoglycoside phosphotransferase (APT) family kinase protein
MTTAAAADDDVVGTHALGAANARPPLLVVDSLIRYLDEHGLGAGELDAVAIGDGHSCVTFRVQRGDGRRLILRRPPRPPVPPSAHDVLREARVLAALQRTPMPVPVVLTVCEDLTVIGAPFYVMEEVAGDVITDSLPPALDNRAGRLEIARRLVETLHTLQEVDWQAVGLDGFGKPTGYLERQLRRFRGLWETNRTREIPAVGRIGRWLEDNMPQSAPATIVHGDYRLGNAMFDERSPARLSAMLDWEMSTIGDPLADVGFMAVGWSEPDDPPSMFDLSPVTRASGFPARQELVAMYEEVSGRRVHDIAWYATLALWKSIVFMEGNYKRAMMGASDDPFLKDFGGGVLEIARRAERVGPGGKGLG